MKPTLFGSKLQVKVGMGQIMVSASDVLAREKFIL